MDPFTLIYSFSKEVSGWIKGKTKKKQIKDKLALIPLLVAIVSILIYGIPYIQKLIFSDPKPILPLQNIAGQYEAEVKIASGTNSDYIILLIDRVEEKPEICELDYTLTFPGFKKMHIDNGLLNRVNHSIYFDGFGYGTVLNHGGHISIVFKFKNMEKEVIFEKSEM